MLDGWLYLAFFLGVCGIILLLFLTVKYDRPKPKMQDGFGIFFTTSSIGPGLKICWYSVSNSFFSTNDLDRFYIFGGGLAVIWLAVDNIVDLLKQASKAKPVAIEEPSAIEIPAQALQPTENPDLSEKQ